MIISGGVKTLENDPDNSDVCVSVSVNHVELVPDGVFFVTVSFSESVTPLPDFDLVTEANIDTDCDIVDVTVSVPVCSRVDDCVRDMVKSFVYVAVMVAIDLVGVGDAENSLESVNVDVMLELVPITEMVSVSVLNSVIVTLPVGVGGGVIVRVMVWVVVAERDWSCVADTDAVSESERVTEVLAMGDGDAVGDVVGLG